MKKYIPVTTLKRLVPAIAALGLIAIPVVQADDDREEAREEAREEREEAREEARESREEAREEREEREPLKAEVNATFVEGFTIPAEHRTYFREVPAPDVKNVVVRYYGGRAYYVNSADWKIVRAVNLDPTIKVATEDAVLVEGYVIPEDRRTRFIDVAAPDSGVTVRYYNNTAYYVDASHRIVRAVPLRR